MKHSDFSPMIGVFILFNIINLGSSYTYKTEYFNCRLDHFNFVPNNTFQLRYLINDTYWSSSNRNAPIFFYTGNEGDIVGFAENTGFMWEIAPDFKALIVFAEHRYYGESLPFGNKSYSPENLGYLSSSQALMDYVDLIAYLKKNKKDHPVIVFGGSYGGMLSAWMRMKYPAVVDGAIAASAPIWQFTGMTPCNAFNRVLTSVFKMESHRCRNIIRKSWETISNITSTDDGKAWLSNAWKLCPPLKTQEDVTTLTNYLNDMYENLAMVNYPYPANFLKPLPGHPVKVFCSQLSNDNVEGKELLTDLYKAVSVYVNYTGSETCFNYSDADAAIGANGWDYQSCTEMVMPMCSDGRNDMFEPSKWNLTVVRENCRTSYNVEPQEYLVKNLYGGKDISTASNIIFSNGLLDPWSSGGVLRNVSSTAQAVIIPDSAHHLDLRASNPADPTDVKMAREYYRYVISQWIKEATNY